MICICILFLAASEPVFAQTHPSARPQQSQKKKVPRRPVEKDAEGSKAPNRFEADPVIHSDYQHEGQKLEVDPD